MKNTKLLESAKLQQPSRALAPIHIASGLNELMMILFLELIWYNQYTEVGVMCGRSLEIPTSLHIFMLR